MPLTPSYVASLDTLTIAAATLISSLVAVTAGSWPQCRSSDERCRSHPPRTTVGERVGAAAKILMRAVWRPDGPRAWRLRSFAAVAEVLRLNGFSTAHIGSCHEVPTCETSPMGPFDGWPTHRSARKSRCRPADVKA